VGSIGWSSCNGGVDSSIEEDRDRNMAVTTTIRAAIAIVIRIMALPLLGRDRGWCVKGSVEVIGCSPVANMRTQTERAALRRYFSLGKTVAIVAERPNTRRKRASILPASSGVAHVQWRAVPAGSGRIRPRPRPTSPSFIPQANSRYHCGAEMPRLHHDLGAHRSTPAGQGSANDDSVS
jgi:hypothetical protein